MELKQNDMKKSWKAVLWCMKNWYGTKASIQRKARNYCGCSFTCSMCWNGCSGWFNTAMPGHRTGKKTGMPLTATSPLSGRLMTMKTTVVTASTGNGMQVSTIFCKPRPINFQSNFYCPFKKNYYFCTRNKEKYKPINNQERVLLCWNNKTYRTF